MTTERRASNREARHRVSPLELRLYVAALLAAVYTISWRAIGDHAPTTKTVVARTPPTSEPQRFVWIDSLPLDLQPAIAMPAGWQRASERQAPTTQIARPDRVIPVPNRRIPRVRTRSS